MAMGWPARALFIEQRLPGAKQLIQQAFGIRQNPSSKRFGQIV